jgi:hypothetical protein
MQVARAGAEDDVHALPRKCDTQKLSGSARDQNGSRADPFRFTAFHGVILVL